MPRRKRQNTSRKKHGCSDKGESRDKSLPGNELEETGVDSSTNRDDDEDVTAARHNKSPESGETSFLCNYCEFSTSNRSKCSEHSKQHKIHCHVREFSSLSREQLAKHCKSQRGLCLDVSSTDRAFFMPCTFCSFVTFSRENLEKHVIQKHPGKQINHTVKKMTHQFDTQINKANEAVSKSSIELTGHLNIGVKANPIVIKDSTEEDNKVKLEIKCKTDAIGDIQNVSALEKDELLKQQLVLGIYSDMLTLQRQQLGNGAVNAKDETFAAETTSHFRSVYCLTCQYSSTSIINLKDHTFDQHPLSSAAGTFNPNGQSRDPQDTVFFCVDKNCTYSSSSFPLFQEHLIKCCACKNTFTAIEKERIHSTISYILEYGKKYNMKIRYDFFDSASSYLGPSFLENQISTSSVSVMNNQTNQADPHSLQTHSAETSTQNPFLETNFNYTSPYDTQNSSENVTSGVYHQSGSTQSSRPLSGSGTRNTQTLESSRVSAHRGANSQMEQSRMLTGSEGRKSSESGQSDLMQMCSILPIVDETNNHKGSCPNQLLNINSSSSLYGDLSNIPVGKKLQLPLAKQSLSTQTNPHCSQMDQTLQLGSSFQPLPRRLLQGMLQTNLNHGHQSALLKAVQNFNQVPCCDPAAKAGSAFHAYVSPGKPDTSSLEEVNPPFTSTASDIYRAPLVRFASVNSENMPYHNTNVNQDVTGSSNRYNMTTASAGALETLSQSMGLDFSSGSPAVMLPDKFSSVSKVQGLRNSDYIEPRRSFSYPVPQCQRSPVSATTQGLALHSFSEVPQGHLIASSCQGSVLPLHFHQSMPVYSQTQTKTYQSPLVASQECFHVHQVSRLPSSFLQDPVCSQTQMGFQQLPQGHPAVCQDGSDLPSSLYQGAPEYAQSQARIERPPEMAHQRHSTVLHQQIPSTSSSFHDGTQMKSQDQIMVQKSPSVLAAGHSAVSQNEYGLLLSYPQKAAADYQTPLRVQQSNSVTPQGHSAVDCYERSLSFNSETDVSFEVQGMVHQPPQIMPPVHSSVCSGELSLHTTVAKNYVNQHHRNQVSVPSNSHTGCHQTNMGNSLKADAAIQANQNPTTSNKTAQTFVLSEQSSYVQALPPRSFPAVKSPVAGVPLYNPPPSYFNACVYTATTGNVPLGLPESCTPGINVNAANPKTRASCQSLNTNPNCPAPPRSDKLNCTEPGMRRKESGLAVASLQGTCAPVPSRNFSQHVRRVSFTQEKQYPKASRVPSLRSKQQPPGLAPKASGGDDDDDDVILTADTRLPPEQQRKFSQSFIRKPTGHGVVKSAPRLKRLAALDSQSTSQNSSRRMLNGSGPSPKQLPKHFDAHDYFEYLACKAIPQISIDKSCVIIDDDDDGGGMNATVGKNSEKTGQGKVMITTKFSYSCFHCGKRLPRELLKQHMSSYHKDIVGTLRDAETGNLKFLCPQLACNFMTNTKNRLRNHLLKCYSQDKSELPDFGTGIKSARSLKNKQGDVLSFRGSKDNPIDLEDRSMKDNFSRNLSDAFGLVINMSERQEPNICAQMCVSCQVVPPQRENKHGRLQKRMLHPAANADSRGGYSAHSGDSQMVDRAARSRSAVTNHCRQNNEKQAGKSTRKETRKSLRPSLTVPQYVQEIPSCLLDPVKHKDKPVSPFRPPKSAQRISSVIVLDADSSEQREKGAQENVQNLPSQRAQKLMPVKSCSSSSEHIKARLPENIQHCSQVASAGQNVPFSTASLLESSMKSSGIGSLGPDHSAHNLECSATSILPVGAQPNMPFKDKYDCVEEVNSAVVTEAPFTRLREVPVQQITTQLLAKLKKLTNSMDVNSITSSKITNSSQRAPDTSPPQSNGSSGSLPETGITDTDLVRFSQTSEKLAVPVLGSVDIAVKKVEGVCKSPGAVSETVEQVGDLSSPEAVVNKQLTVASGAPCKELSGNLELAINSDKPTCGSSPARISTRKQKSIVRQNSHLLRKDHLKQEIEIVFPPLQASAHLKPVLVTLKASEGSAGCPGKEVITADLFKQENMSECGREYKSDNKSVKKSGVSGEQSADLGCEAREPGKCAKKHCAVFEKITKRKFGRDRTLKNKHSDVINQTTGQLLPKKRKMERQSKMCCGGEKDEATETIVEEYYVRRSSRKRKSVINNSCSDSDNFNELFQDFVDDDVDNYDSGDEYRIDSDDYGSDTDNEQKERPEKSRKVKLNMSSLPPDPATFRTSTRGRFKCYFCQRAYRECLTVKTHVLKKHGGRLCAVDLDQCEKTDEERLLLFCPRECVYVTSSPEGFNTHVKICTKRVLETDMDKFSKWQSGGLKAAVHARKSASMDLDKDKDRLKLH